MYYTAFEVFLEVLWCLYWRCCTIISFFLFNTIAISINLLITIHIFSACQIGAFLSQHMPRPPCAIPSSCTAPPWTRCLRPASEPGLHGWLVLNGWKMVEYPFIILLSFFLIYLICFYLTERWETIQNQDWTWGKPWTIRAWTVEKSGSHQESGIKSPKLWAVKLS